MAEQNRLKSGFSTGSHASAALKGALRFYFSGRADRHCEIPYPAGAGDAGMIPIELERLERHESEEGAIVLAESRKENNDDEDVTKGLLIQCLLATEMKSLLSFLNPHPHAPHVLTDSDGVGPGLQVFAGRGLGVTTLSGLRVPPGFPAINPGPLSVMQQIYRDTLREARENGIPLTERAPLHALFTVEDGEAVALKTANGRVGILGGLSLLGSHGIVKPLSSQAYLESLRAEISVAKGRGGEIFFVIGNSALHYVEGLANDERRSVIETGNFLFDSLSLLSGMDLSRLTLIAGAGKMTRLAHGYRNTHQKFGTIIPDSVLDFALEDSAFPAEWRPQLQACPRGSATVRAIEEHLRERNADAANALMQVLAKRGAATLHDWVRECNVCIHEIRVILLDSLSRPHTSTLRMTPEESC